MKKYRCECKSAKCEVEREDNYTPKYCTCYCTKEADWQEVKEEEKTEKKAEVKAKLPSWCKVGEVVYFTKLSKYCKVLDIDMEKGIKIQTDVSNGWVENFYDLLEARLRPFNEKEMRELVGKTVVDKLSERICLVVSCGQLYVSVYGYTYSNEELLDSFTFTDGTPCGVYEHFKNGEWVK